MPNNSALVRARLLPLVEGAIRLPDPGKKYGMRRRPQEIGETSRGGKALRAAVEEASVWDQHAAQCLGSRLRLIPRIGLWVSGLKEVRVEGKCTTA